MWKCPAAQTKVPGFICGSIAVLSTSTLISSLRSAASTGPGIRSATNAAMFQAIYGFMDAPLAAAAPPSMARQNRISNAQFATLRFASHAARRPALSERPDSQYWSSYWRSFLDIQGVGLVGELRG